MRFWLYLLTGSTALAAFSLCVWLLANARGFAAGVNSRRRRWWHRILHRYWGDSNAERSRHA